MPHMWRWCGGTVVELGARSGEKWLNFSTEFTTAAAARGAPLVIQFREPQLARVHGCCHLSKS